MSEEVPPERPVGQLVHFLECFLDLVFAEVELASVGKGAHVLCGERFRDGDEPDGGGIASRPAGRALDTRADVSQPGPERNGVDHYFFSEPRIPFAVAAFGPSGASLR
jgi:hypothetical protein